MNDELKQYDVSRETRAFLRREGGNAPAAATRISALVEPDVLRIFREAQKVDEFASMRVAWVVIEALRAASDAELRTLVPSVETIGRQLAADGNFEHLLVLWDRVSRALSRDRPQAVTMCKAALLSASVRGDLIAARTREGLLWSVEALDAYQRHVDQR